MHNTTHANKPAISAGLFVPAVTTANSKIITIQACQLQIRVVSLTHGQATRPTQSDALTSESQRISDLAPDKGIDQHRTGEVL